MLLCGQSDDVPEYESVNSQASAASDLESLSGINSSPKIAASSDVHPADNTCSQTDSSKGIVVLATNNADGVRKRDKKSVLLPLQHWSESGGTPLDH